MIEKKIILPVSSSNQQRRSISYLEHNEHAENVVFCVHGLTRNAFDFYYLMHNLAPHYRIISVDLAGRGNSDWLADHTLYNIDTYIHDCYYVIKKLRLSNLVWIGTSLGGIIAMGIYNYEHNIISRLILNDIGSIISSESLHNIKKNLLGIHSFDSQNDIKQYIRKKLTESRISQPEHWQRVYKYSIAKKGDKFVLRYDPKIIDNFIIPQNSIDLNIYWNTIKCPVLLLRGKESKVLLPEVALQMNKADHVTLKEFAKIGHVPSLMENNQIDTILEWLEETK